MAWAAPYHLLVRLTVTGDCSTLAAPSTVHPAPFMSDRRSRAPRRDKFRDAFGDDVHAPFPGDFRGSHRDASSSQGAYRPPPDNDYARPRRTSYQAAPLIAEHVTASVKWYNPTKGFGFISPDDGSPDAFLHASVLEARGHTSVPEGATLVVDLSHGAKGPQVATVHSVDISTAAPSRPRGFPREGSPGGFGGGRDEDLSETADGTVKMFNAEKGFGFIAVPTSGKDVFVHMTVVRRSGLEALTKGDAVRVTYVQGAKGPEARRIEAV